MITMPKIDWKNVVIFALVIILATLGGYAFEIKEELENSKKILAQSENNNETLIVVLKKSVIEREGYKELSGKLVKELDDANELLKKYKHENGKLSKKLRYAKSKTNKIIVAAKKLEKEKKKIEQQLEWNAKLDQLTIKLNDGIIEIIEKQIPDIYTQCGFTYEYETTEAFNIAFRTGYIDEENTIEIGFKNDALNKLAIVLECKNKTLVLSEYMKDTKTKNIVFKLIKETPVSEKIPFQIPSDYEYVIQINADDSDIDEAIANGEITPSVVNDKTGIAKNPT